MRTFIGTVLRHSRRLMSVSLVKISVIGLGVYFVEYAILKRDEEKFDKNSKGNCSKTERVRKCSQDRDLRRR